MEVVRWDHSKFVRSVDPTAEQLSRCEALIESADQSADQSADLIPAVTTHWRVEDGEVQRSPDGVIWDRVALQTPTYGYEPYLVKTGANGEIAVSNCRTEARRSDLYCYHEVSYDDGESWVTFSRVGVFVEKFDEFGVLMGKAGSSAAAETSYMLYDFDGDIIVSIDSVPRSSSIRVLSDRILVIEHGTSLKIDQYPYPE